MLKRVQLTMAASLIGAIALSFMPASDARSGQRDLTSRKKITPSNSLEKASEHVTKPVAPDTTINGDQELFASDGAANDQFGDSVSVYKNFAVIGAPEDDSSKGSAYVFVKSTNWQQSQKLTASDGIANDGFGGAVAITEQTIVVGADGDNSDTGAVYVFTKIGPTWTQQQKLTASDGVPADHFGVSVAISGDSIIVGASGDNVDRGSAYVFTRGDTWTQQQKLLASDGLSGDIFGVSVGICGDRAVVGARLDDVGANTAQGSAYVYVRSGASWSQQQRLLAPAGAANDHFGGAVGISSDTIVVGAMDDDVGANSGQGSAYVFAFSGVTWLLEGTLNNSDGIASDRFGSSVGISGDAIVVGGSGVDIAGNSNQGAAYLYYRVGGEWIEQLKLVASDGAAVDDLGLSAAIADDTIIVGAPLHNIGTTANQGVAYTFPCEWNTGPKLTASDGAANDEFGTSAAILGDTIVVGAPGDASDRGAVYVYVLVGGVWIEQKLTASDGVAADAFGTSVAISSSVANGTTLVVGAPGDNTNKGAAYVFKRSGSTFTQQQKLTATGGVANDEFGGSVAISGVNIIAGAIGADAAYVFVFNVTQWNQQAKLTSGDSAENFGRSVAIEGNTALVGGTTNPVSIVIVGNVHIFERSGTVWTEGQAFSDVSTFGQTIAISGEEFAVGAKDYFDPANGTQKAGFVNLYERVDGSWSFDQKLSGGSVGANFGKSVAIDDNHIVVGRDDDIGGGPAVLVFARTTNVWISQQVIDAPSDVIPADEFARSVGISGKTIVAGIRLDDVSGRSNQGSAYIFANGSNHAPKILQNTVAAATVQGTTETIDIGMVSDHEDLSGDLEVSLAAPVPPSITVTNITNANGSITATIGVSCSAPLGINSIVFRVNDSRGATSSATRTVDVSANLHPSVGTYPATSLMILGNTTVTPDAPPSDNGSVVSLVASSNTFLGGLSANLSTGVVTITNAHPSGAHTIKVTATDNCGLTNFRQFVLTVNCQAITVNPTTIPSATGGAGYSQVFTQTGGSAPVTFSQTGALPGGISFNPGTATLSGTPTQVGNFPIIVAVTDVNGCSASRNYTLVVNPALLTWNGAASTDWDTSTNWTPHNVPANYNDVLIPGGAIPNQPVISGSSPTIHDLTVEVPRTLTINATRQLTAEGDISCEDHIVGGGKLIVAGPTFSQTRIVSVASVEFASGTHSLAGFGVFQANTVTILNGASVTLTTSIEMSTLIINTGGLLNIQNRIVTLTGPGTPLIKNGGLLTSGGTIEFEGSSAQVLPTNISYSNVTINNAAGVSLGGDTTIGGLLTLTTDLATGSSTLTMLTSATSSGPGDVIGNVKRSGFVTGGPALSFGNQFNTIRFNSGTVPTDVTVNLVKSPPSGFGTNVIPRTYTITTNGGSGFIATLRLCYKDAELNGLSESNLELWRFNGSTWESPLGLATKDATANWVEETGITAFSPWVIAGTSGPTEVRMISLEATGYDSGVMLDWSTGFEVDNLGFRIYEQQGGARRMLSKELIAGSALTAGPGTALAAGRSYSYWVDAKAANANASYWIEDIDLNGTSTWHGPILVKQIGGKPLARASAVSLEKLGQAIQTLSRPVVSIAESIAPKPIVSTQTLNQQTSLASSRSIKIGVRQAGWYRITQRQLTGAGLDPNADPRTLRLFVDGVELPILVRGEDDGHFDPNDAIEFYGLGLDTPSTDTRVYWLTAGSEAGSRINRLVDGKGHPSSASFPFTVERRDHSIYFAALKNGDEENFFGAVVGSSAIAQPIALHKLAGQTTELASVELSLQGVTNVDHRVIVNLNGSHLGQMSFVGQSRGRLNIEISHAQLNEGDNVVTLQSTAGPSDISLVESIRITYQHGYTAENDSLFLQAQPGETLNITGFTNKDIRVFDVTDQRNVSEHDVTIDEPKDGYSASFTAAGVGPRRILAIADRAALEPAYIKLDGRSLLRSPSNGADFIIISPADLSDSLTPLVDLRNKQALKTSLVDIEDVYDEFSFGEKSPQAIRDFLSYAATSWQVKPRYVMLAGDSSYDARNYLGFGDNDLVPTRLIDSDYLETASDDWLADFDNDGVADIAIGRLPARSAEELKRMVEKIVAYDRASNSEEVLLVADANDGYDFERAASGLRMLIPRKLRTTQINRGRMTPDEARSLLINAMGRSQMLVNYDGHGSANSWRESLLTSEEATKLTNEHLPMFVMMTCLNGYFHDPQTDSLGESLMKSERGGAIAVWASSGMALPGDQELMNKGLYEALFSNPGIRLGEAIRIAKLGSASANLRKTWILFGDPSMQLK